MSTNTEIDTASCTNNGDANGIASALVAAGIGCLAMGVTTTLSEASKHAADIMNLYKPTGPLSGKSLLATVVWLASWALIGRMLKGKQIHIGKWISFAMICVGIGFIMTFPPFFNLFGDK